MRLLRHTILPLTIIAAAAACSSAPATTRDAGPPPASDAGTPSTAITTQFQLRSAMRQLWEDHIFWTRIYLIDAIGHLPETSFTATRLLANQDDIGNALRPFYGDAAANQLTSLLHDHITGAVTVVTAAMNGDQSAFATANAAWYDNGYQIARFLAAADPSWSVDVLKTHMNEHLDLTLAEATARLNGDWAGDVAAYDAVHEHILTFADFLAAGVGQQFPNLVGPSTITSGDEGLHVAMRRLWEDHVQWTRVVIVDQTSNLPDLQLAEHRLLQNQVDIGNAIKPFFGAQAGDALASLLHDHIMGAVTLLVAVENGNPDDIASAKAAWYANADQIAQFLANANPNWRLADLQSHMKTHLDQTLTEAAARLAKDWAGDVPDYDAVAAHILVMADVLSAGIFAQFPEVVR